MVEIEASFPPAGETMGKNTGYKKIPPKFKEAGSRRRFQNRVTSITMPEEIIDQIDALVPVMAQDPMIRAIHGRVTRAAVVRACVLLGLEHLRTSLEDRGSE